MKNKDEKLMKKNGKIRTNKDKIMSSKKMLVF